MLYPYNIKPGCTGTVTLEAGTRDHSISNNANNDLVIRAGTGGDVIIMLG